MSKPLVSVALPVYRDSVDYIRQAVDSILSKTFNDFELVLIFDTGVDDPYF